MNDSDGVCFYLQVVMEAVLVNTQDFTINSSDGVCGGACSYPHVVVLCF